jgi:hypothetical protein
MLIGKLEAGNPDRHGLLCRAGCNDECVQITFHAMVKANVATTAIPGAAIGRIILYSDCKLVQPSIKAASSKDSGIALKYEISI